MQSPAQIIIACRSFVPARLHAFRPHPGGPSRHLMVSPKREAT